MSTSFVGSCSIRRSSRIRVKKVGSVISVDWKYSLCCDSPILSKKLSIVTVKNCVKVFRLCL